MVIIGAGFSGLGMAIKLKSAGMDDFIVLEEADEVGGTWRQNTYPGCASDIGSMLYSYSFEPKADWSRMFPQRSELWDYLKHCADKYGVRSHIRFGVRCTGAEFDDAADQWRVFTEAGETLRARALVAGMGPLHLPKIPNLPGLERFTGPAFHSSRWDHSVDLAGKRVAVIGTGASATQFVPHIVGQTAMLYVFQRTPAWIIPRLDRRVSAVERRVFRRAPASQRAMRYLLYWYQESWGVFLAHPRLIKVGQAIAGWRMRRQVADPQLRRKLTPDYTMGCKRILLSDDYYPTLARPDVELVTERIAEVRERGIVTDDGVERAADVIIFGTGFHVADRFENAHIVGRDGLKIADVWRDGPQAYLGVAVAGFPNLFLLLGPNSGTGYNSAVFMLEAQIGHILRCLRLLQDRGARRIEVRSPAQSTLNRKLQDQLRRVAWNAGGCQSWYVDAHGVNRVIWPRSTVRFWLRTRWLRTADYQLDT